MRVGSRLVKSVWLGNRAVKRVWRGDTVVWTPPEAGPVVTAARYLEGYFETYFGLRLRDINPAWNLVKLAFLVGVEGAGNEGRVRPWPGSEAGGPNTNNLDTIAADVAELAGRGVLTVWSIGGAADMVRPDGSTYRGFQFHTTQHVDRFMETVVPIIDATGVGGIDWDLEAQEDWQSADAMIDASRRLIARYGPEFFVGCAPYGGRNDGTTHPWDSGAEQTALTAKYQALALALGPQLKLMAMQFYMMGDNTVAAVKTWAREFIARCGLTDAQWAFGFTTHDPSDPKMGAVSAEFARDVMVSWRAEGRDAGGVMHWSINRDTSDADSGRFARIVGGYLQSLPPLVVSGGTDTGDGGTPPDTSVRYRETYDIGTGGWEAESNATGLTRDTTRDTGGALTWTATSAGGSRVKSPVVSNVLGAGVELPITARVSHADSSARQAQVQLYEFDSAGSFLEYQEAPAAAVQPGQTPTSVTGTITTVNPACVGVRVLVQGDAVEGGRFYLHDLTVAGGTLVTEPPPPGDEPEQVYLQTFAVDTATWQASVNATDVRQDTARIPAGALRWTVPAAGGTEVQGPTGGQTSAYPAVAPGEVLTLDADAGHTANTGLDLYVACYFFDSGLEYVPGSERYGPVTAVQPSASGTVALAPLVVAAVPAGAAHVRILVGSGAAVPAGTLMYADNVRVTRPA